MYSYTFDESTGGIILNSTPTNFSKEPRPVYAQELNILGFNKYWDYDDQNDTPYMWAESNIYWYRGVQIAKTKGGDLYTRPEYISTLAQTFFATPFSCAKTSGAVRSMMSSTRLSVTDCKAATSRLPSFFPQAQSRNRPSRNRDFYLLCLLFCQPE